MARFSALLSTESISRSGDESLIMKALASVTLVALFAFSAVAQNTKLVPKELKVLEGAAWTGTLTYLDYSSGKKTSIKSDLTISKLGERKWSFAFTYPDEPKANSKDDVLLSEDGRTFDGETVVERTKLKNGILRIVTSRPGKDNDKPATIRHTYLFSKTEFSIRKDVKLDGGTEFFERNTYSWQR